MMAHLRQQGVTEDQLLSMNFESMRFADLDGKGLYQYVMERAPQGKRFYLFLDEVQKITDWQNAVNSFRVDLDCDIYVTGSNSRMLSSELATYLTGRYVAFHVMTLSFREYLTFHDLQANDPTLNRKEEFQKYLRMKSLPSNVLQLLLF